VPDHGDTLIIWADPVSVTPSSLVAISTCSAFVVPRTATFAIPGHAPTRELSLGPLRKESTSRELARVIWATALSSLELVFLLPRSTWWLIDRRAPAVAAIAGPVVTLVAACAIGCFLAFSVRRRTWNPFGISRRQLLVAAGVLSSVLLAAVYSLIALGFLNVLQSPALR